MAELGKIGISMKIEENRKAIDSIDAQIIELLNERTRHALDIGAAKVE